MKKAWLLGVVCVAGCSGKVPELESQSQAVTAGLVAAYGFEEGSGTTTADRSGNNFNGTLSSVTWSSSGRFGNALQFSGVSAAGSRCKMRPRFGSPPA